MLDIQIPKDKLLNEPQNVDKSLLMGIILFEMYCNSKSKKKMPNNQLDFS